MERKELIRSWGRCRCELKEVFKHLGLMMREEGMVAWCAPPSPSLLPPSLRHPDALKKTTNTA